MLKKLQHILKKIDGILFFINKIDKRMYIYLMKYKNELRCYLFRMEAVHTNHLIWRAASSAP
jgi:hypothetical protein